MSCSFATHGKLCHSCEPPYFVLLHFCVTACKMPQKESKQPLGPPVSHLPRSRGHCGDHGARGGEILPSSMQQQRSEFHSGLIHQSQQLHKGCMKAQKPSPTFGVVQAVGQCCPSAAPGAIPEPSAAMDGAEAPSPAQALRA